MILANGARGEKRHKFLFHFFQPATMRRANVHTAHCSHCIQLFRSYIVMVIFTMKWALPIVATRSLRPFGWTKCQRPPAVARVKRSHLH